MRSSLICKVDRCDKDVKAKGLCQMHYIRFRKYGDYERRMTNWHAGSCRHEQGYIRVHVGNNQYRLEHDLIAEKALGRPLPPKAVMHHVNGDPSDNKRPWNLVLCPNQNYHLLLHRRAQALGYEPPGGFGKAKKPRKSA